MRAVVLAYHDVGCACLETLLEAGDDVVAVFTHRDDPGERVWFRSVAELAARHGIPVHVPDKINRPEHAQAIRELRPDILFSFYYRRLVDDAILAIPPLGAMNLHGSLLPRYRGRSPVNWVLVEGERETGVSLHYMVRKPDAGDLVAQRRIVIEPRETARTLFTKVTLEAAELLRETLPAIRAGTNARIPQELSAGSYRGGRRPEDGRIDWRWPATRIDALVRAVTHPFPGAFTGLGGRRLDIWEAEPALGAAQGAEVAGACSADDPAMIQTGDGRLLLRRCALEGEDETDAADLVCRGLLAPGVRLDLD